MLSSRWFTNCHYLNLIEIYKIDLLFEIQHLQQLNGSRLGISPLTSMLDLVLSQHCTTNYRQPTSLVVLSSLSHLFKTLHRQYVVWMNTFMQVSYIQRCPAHLLEESNKNTWHHIHMLTDSITDTHLTN